MTDPAGAPITLLWAHSTTAWDEPTLQRARQRVPPHLLDRMPRYRRWQDVQMGLLGKLLLARSLQLAGVEPARLDDLVWSDHGRPELPGAPGDFNISHSGGLVVCALDPGGRIGVDVERIHAIALEDLRDVLSERERHAIDAAADQDVEFCRIWTFKEAVLKADGRGVSLELRRVESGESSVEIDGHRWHLTPVELTAGFSCHLASSRAAPDLAVHEVPLAALLDPGGTGR